MTDLGIIRAVAEMRHDALHGRDHLRALMMGLLNHGTREADAALAREILGQLATRMGRERRAAA